jgi:hypothetical protein
MPNSKLSKIFREVFGGKQEFPSEEDIEEDSKILNYINNLEIKPDIANLSGPFLQEKYAINHLDIYGDLLEKTYFKVNCFASRRFIVVSEDATLITRDNQRIDLNIPPANHELELSITSIDFQVIAIDKCILLNVEDTVKIKNIIKKSPLENSELCRCRKV